MTQRKISLAMLVIIALAMSAGCRKDPEVDEKVKPEKLFQKLSEMGVYDGLQSDIYLYDEEKAQYAVSTQFNTVRIQNDDRSKFVQIVMGAAPETGKVLDATITSHGIASVDPVKTELTVIKMENGKVWLMGDGGTRCYVMPWNN